MSNQCAAQFDAAPFYQQFHFWKSKIFFVFKIPADHTAGAGYIVHHSLLNKIFKINFLPYRKNFDFSFSIDIYRIKI
jgi:hypothetical protein